MICWPNSNQQTMKQPRVIFLIDGAARSRRAWVTSSGTKSPNERQLRIH